MYSIANFNLFDFIYSKGPFNIDLGSGRLKKGGEHLDYWGGQSILF